MLERPQGNYLKGLCAELKVIFYLQSLSWTLISHRKKIFSTEIDLIFETPKKDIVFIEVKNITSSYFNAYRWSRKQKAQFLKTIQKVQVHRPEKQIFGIFVLVKGLSLQFYYLDEV